MRYFKLTLFSAIFLVFLTPVIVSIPLAYSYVAINWDTQPVMSDYSEVCEDGDNKCIDREIRLDIATPIFAFVSFIFFCATGIIFVIYLAFYIRWLRRNYFCYLFYNN